MSPTITYTNNFSYISYKQKKHLHISINLSCRIIMAMKSRAAFPFHFPQNLAKKSLASFHAVSSPLPISFSPELGEEISWFSVSSPFPISFSPELGEEVSWFPVSSPCTARQGSLGLPLAIRGYLSLNFSYALT